MNCKEGDAVPAAGQHPHDAPKAAERTIKEAATESPRSLPSPLLHVVLFQPQIAPNTGNVGRLCAVTRSRLHLIHPLGFEISDRTLRRAGMDYWRALDVHEHADWAAFRASAVAPARLWLFTTKSEQSFWDVPFADGDGLVFGNEGHGAPEWLHAEIGAAHSVTLPQRNADLRSLNLSTAVGIATYEAYRQLGA